MIWLYTLPLWGVPALWVLYPLAIQYERGGWWRLCYIPAVPAGVLDVLLNHTTLAVLTWSFPRLRRDKYEFTFSDRLARLYWDEGWRGHCAVYLKQALDGIAPSGVHIHPQTVDVAT